MLWRLAFPLLLIFTPLIIPRVVRTVRLVWKLSFDHRVPLLLRLLVPATLIYFLTPFARVPLVGPVGYILVLLAAIWLLLNLAPRDAIADYAPWRARQRTASSDSKKGSSRVVEGSYHVVDEEEKPK